MLRRPASPASLRLRLLVAVGAALGACLAALPAEAGVVLQFEHRSPGDKAAMPGSAWIEADRLRIESDGQVMIFRADKAVLWAWGQGEKQYLELTREQAAEMGGMMAAMQKELAGLSPAERAMAEQMMAARMGAASSRWDANAKAPEPMNVTSLGKTETIHGWACSAQEVRRGTTLEGEYWTTGWEQFGIVAADFAVFETFAEFLREATGGMSARVENPFGQPYGADGLPGVPVRVISPEKGGGSSVHEITKLEKHVAAATLFDLPPGMTKKPIEMPAR